MRGLRRVLRGCGAAVALLALSAAPSSASDSCASFAGDALLQRVDAHLSVCLPPSPSSPSLDAFTDALVTNELDATQRQPLAVVAFASSPRSLARFAASVATAVAGVEPVAPRAVRVLDLHAAVDSPRPAHELTRALRREMARALASCAQQRTLVIVRGLERVRGDKLPLLDVFLDPLNGARATLHDAASGRDLDTRRALFVFLYERETSERVGAGAAWRDFLAAKWRASAAAAQQLASEAFTPQALAGRLTTAVVWEDDDAEDGAVTTGDNTWTQICELDAFLARLREAQRRLEATDPTPGGGVGLLGVELLSAQSAAAVLGLAVLVVGGLLVSTKSFVARSKQEAVRVEVAKAARSKKQSKQKRRASAQPDTERMMSLRSHSGTTTPTATPTTTPRASSSGASAAIPMSTPVAPASPVLTPVAISERQTASPDPKTPTPTKPRRTGKARRGGASSGPQTTTKMTTRQSRHT